MSETAQLEPVVSGDNTRFLVGNPKEVVRLLRRLLRRRAMISAFFNTGNDLLLTVVLKVDSANNRLILDGSGNEVQSRRLAESGRVVFVTFLDKVKVQFAGVEVRRSMFEGHPAFVMPIPDEVLYLQRREFYRLHTPVANPLLCKVPLENNQVVDLVILDISAGGVGLQIDGKTEGFSTEVDTEYLGCSIELPGIATLEVNLRVRYSAVMTLRNGEQAQRCGCMFTGLLPATQTIIQRYIVRLERELIVKTPGRR